jgi:hypothetical protein
MKMAKKINLWFLLLVVTAGWFVNERTLLYFMVVLLANIYFILNYREDD